MTSMTSANPLIDRLVENLAPRKRAPTFSRMTWTFLCFVLLSFVVNVLIFGFRSDLFTIMQSPWFWLDLGTYLLVCVGFLVLALLSLNPMTLHRIQKVSWSVGLFGVSWFLSLGLSMLAEFKSFASGFNLFQESVYLPCFWQVAIGSVIGFASMFTLIRRGFIMNSVPAALFAASGIVLQSALSLQFTCSAQIIEHTLDSHLIPMLGFFGIVFTMIFLFLRYQELRLARQLNN